MDSIYKLVCPRIMFKFIVVASYKQEWKSAETEIGL